MARKGIYVNGKEIVARYFGDKLVWRKEKWTEVASFGDIYDWQTYGDIIMRRVYLVQHIEKPDPFVDYGATKAKINGKMYDIQGAQSVREKTTYYGEGELYGQEVTRHIDMIIFHNRIQRDEAYNMHPTSITLYRKG